MSTQPTLIQRVFGSNLSALEIRTLLQSLQAQGGQQWLDELSGFLVKVRTMLDLSQDMSDTLALDILLERLVSLAIRSVQGERGTLFLHDVETDELFSRIIEGEDIREIRFESHRGVAGHVFQQAEALCIDDAYTDPRFNSEVDRETGYKTRSIICVPIPGQDKGTMGVLQILNKVEGVFDHGDLLLLESIAAQASAALQSARLYEEVRQAHEEETQLLEITKAISTELQLQPLLLKIMETTTAILKADRSTLFLHDESSHELWALIAQGTNNVEIRFPSHLGIAGESFSQQKIINIPDAYADSRFNPEVDRKTGYRTRSILCMPVFNKEEKILGVIQVLNKHHGPFTAKDERRLWAFAAQASIALENAKLFEEVLNVKNYNESILESLNNGVLTLDSQLNIVKWNHACDHLFGQSIDPLLQQPASALLTGSNAWILERLTVVQESGQPDLHVDVEIHVEGGAATSVNLNIVPLLDIDERQIGTMLVFEDITREKRLRGTMARYMTKEVAEQLLEAGEEGLGGQMQEVTILFSDIRRFTSISETIGAQETVSLLNDYFSLMVDILFRHKGILDKYIGDAIMAVFGTPFQGERDADNAVRTAAEMLSSLRKFNEERKQRGLEALDVGIGINTGIVISGNIGSPKRMDYTVIGDGVNLAARLESANKFYKTQLLISEFTRQCLQESYLLREVDRIQVKGKQEPVSVYEVLDHIDPARRDRMESLVELFRKGLRLYREHRWMEAREFFESGQRLVPEDGPTQLYIKRCLHFEQTPPPKDWDGIWTWTEK